MRSKALIAGIIIGVAGFSFLSIQGICGAFLFSFGLISIIVLKFNLYTGKIAYINKTNIYELFVILIYNIIGASIVGLLLNPIIAEQAKIIALNKLSSSTYITLIKSICCGLCIYIAVESYKKTQSIITIILPIMVFILSGFEHCIANIFYYNAARLSPIIYYKHFFVCVIGNSIGSIIIHLLHKETKYDL